MNSSKLSNNICRICLDQKIILNWNEELFEFCGISYKDCYYKYTQLDEGDSDHYPTNLCEMCADELKNAHFLFEKALESYNILQVTLTAKKLDFNNSIIENCSSPSKTQCEIYNCEGKKLIQSSKIVNHSDKDQLEQFSSLGDTGRSITESCANVTIEPSHFIDIRNFELSDEMLLEEQVNERSNFELPESSVAKYAKKRKKHQAVPKSSNEEELAERNEVNSTKTIIEKSENTRIKCVSPSKSSFEQDLSEKCETKSLPPSSSNHGFKTRKKYILICQYCSLKVNGTNQLKIHEATHSENRKRNEICPQCGVKLYTKMALNEHMKIHDENRQKKYKCEFCKKAFFNRGGLNVHRRIHLGLMVKCQICPKEFFRQIDLDKHLLKHSASPLQKNVGKKKYAVQCQYCNKSVLTDKWKEHLAAHLDQPQMKCKICDKKFFARSKCTKHLKQVHHKTLSEYEDFIHYYVDRNSRITNLRMKQQLSVQQITE